MIDLDEIAREIDRLKTEQTTYKNCERLAVLTTVLSYFAPKSDQENAYSERSVNTSLNLKMSPTGTEFSNLAYSTDLDKLIGVLDEHMSAIKLVYPKEYALIIRKLEE